MGWGLKDYHYALFRGVEEVERREGEVYTFEMKDYWK